jgi:hypothetical protein
MKNILCQLNSSKFGQIPLVLFLLFFLNNVYPSDQAHAAPTPRICVQEYFVAIERGDIVASAIELSDAGKLIEEIAGALNFSMNNFAVLECDTPDKAYAWVAEGVLDVKDGQYIVYDPTWVQNVIGDDRYYAGFLFGHEIGHLISMHFSSNKDLTKIAKETQADKFAGCAVAKLGGDWEVLENLTSRLRPEVDGSYPSAEKSLEVASVGFKNCGGAMPVDEEEIFIEGEEQMKDIDDDLVEPVPE